MMFLRKYFVILIVTICLLNFIESAPTTSDDYESDEKEDKEEGEVEEVENLGEVIDETDPCEIDELKSLFICEENDKECESKNEQVRLKREAICNQNPTCSYCNDSQIPDELPDSDDDENLVVIPEIVATLIPPAELNDDSIPVDETIVIDGSLEQVIDENQTTTDATKPLKLIERNIVVENDNEKHFYRGYVDPSSNVTTIIRLTNLINNTNVVNMPTTLNNTNINNIHVYSNKSSSREGGKYGLGFNEDGPCCYAMKPGLCKQTTAGLKCRHKKTRVCGQQCTRKMIHNKNTFCNRIPYWPYILCPPPTPQYPFFPSQPGFPPQIGDEFDDDDDLPLFPTDEELESEESDWIVYQEKCKIVSEDGLQITNCTQKNEDFEHPYARNSVDNVQSKRSVRHIKKGNRHNIQQQQEYYPYGYPMMQPMYFQPIPMFMPPPQFYPMMPQYYQQAPPMNPYYPQQLPLPPIDTESYYDEPIIIREVNPYKNSRKHSKKHPIVFDHDDEL